MGAVRRACGGARSVERGGGHGANRGKPGGGHGADDGAGIPAGVGAMTRGMALALMMLFAELAAGIGYVWTAQDRSIDAAYAARRR